MEGKNVHCGCDTSNKGGYHQKRIAWFNAALDKFESVVLDSDVCEGTDVDIAISLDHAF